MTRFGIIAGSVLALSFPVTAASAASLSGFGAVTSGTDAGIVKIHGVHRSCESDRFGWHRSPWWGDRDSCRSHWGWGWGRWRGHRDHDDDDRHGQRHDGRNGRDDDDRRGPRNEGRNGHDHDDNRPVARGEYHPPQQQQVPAQRKWNQGSY